jgi:hypothetical protein
MSNVSALATDIVLVAESVVVHPDLKSSDESGHMPSSGDRSHYVESVEIRDS